MHILTHQYIWRGDFFFFLIAYKIDYGDLVSSISDGRGQQVGNRKELHPKSKGSLL